MRSSARRPAVGMLRLDPLDAVVRRFLGDDHVVHVALAQARRGDAHEARAARAAPRAFGAPTVAHARAQAADELVDVDRERAAVRHAALDALGHELLVVVDLALEVAVLAALRHRAERAHAAVDLVRAALVEDELAGRLVGAGEERADHHASTRPRRAP